MDKTITYFKLSIKKHYLAILVSILVGLIYVLPNIFFVISLGDRYRGLPMIATANEDFYLARIQEIIDGHPMLGSFAFYDYKDHWSLTPPTAELFYAVPSMLLRVKPADIVVASRFILPLILFLLVYYLINSLTIDSSSIANKFNAIAGGLLVTLGYDLVDYRSLWLFLTGKVSLGGKFLIWARPVNPIFGAIFLFSFLICLWLIIRKSSHRKKLIFFAALFLALMIASYFFSWGVAISVLAVLILMYWLKKEYQTVKNFLWVIFFAVIVSLPYWYLSFKASQSPFYHEALLKNGLFYTHYPLFNQVILAVFLLYVILFTPWLIKKVRLIFKNKLPLLNQVNLAKAQDWNLFCLALLLGSFWALNEQVVTGRTVWPFHFVQYTIPLAMMVVMVLLYNIINQQTRYLWLVITVIIFSLSLLFGVAIQAGTYKLAYNQNLVMQTYRPVFDWLDQQAAKDCVVLVTDDNQDERDAFNGLIPAFTHCNIYASAWAAFNLIEPYRAYFNYLVLLRLKNVSANGIEKYLAENRGEATGYLFSNWKNLYGVKQFPDFSDPELSRRLKRLPEDYRQFVKQDFTQELKKYRLDYVMSVGELNKTVKNLLPSLQPVDDANGIFFYKFAR